MTCKIKDIPVYYEEYGEGKPVLCIHGYSVDHRLMSGCLEPVFSEVGGYQRIYLDLPGMGQTPSAKWIKSGDQVLKIIMEFINIMIPEQNFLVAGESYGGYLTLGLLHNMADRVDGVLLICPQMKSWIINNIEKEKLPAHQLLYKSEDMPVEEVEPDVTDFLNISAIATPAIYSQYQSDILSGMKIADQEFLFHYFDGAYRHDFEAGLRIMEYHKPACILTGRQDHFVGYLEAFEVAKRFSRATFAVLDCAGHNLQIDNEPVFSQMVKDWIWRVEIT